MAGTATAAAAGGRATRTRVLAILGALVALGPLSTDAYVPALPDLAPDLGTSASSAQLSITTCLVGLAVGQILAGPLSDAYGRRRPLLLGLTLYTVAGLLCAVAPSIWLLVALRGIQGVGGAFGIVIAYAAVRDQFSGVAAARYFAMLLLVTGLAPVLSPLAGGQLLRVTSWEGIFVALAALSGLLLLAAGVGLPETLAPQNRHSGGLRQMGPVFRRLLADRVFVGYCLANSLAFAAMFAYISGSPFVLQDIHGLNPQEYSLVFAVNALGLVIAAQVSGRVVHRVGGRFLLRLGLLGSMVGGLGVGAAVLAEAGVAALLVALFVVVASVGLVMPNAAALALEDHGAVAGTASAVLGCAQFLVGGCIAPLVGVAGNDSAVPMAIVIAALGTTALAVFLGLTGSRDRAVGPPTTEPALPSAPTGTARR
ncbi:Bcr/CflA family drug resistance efflux transporter [Frankia sp. CcI49]|uniref:multidrug effflux MFS transporter n=1 Tax=unclassified Frankia TaxID=2632575 RepID=UPI0007C7F871|nr:MULTISPECIES: multidrug effflux MFS transporter [unclassified Frankia]ONH51669.1 Bcr/CflA family drug resistance efflux transporter [Frankia sp. CcI49]